MNERMRRTPSWLRLALGVVMLCALSLGVLHAPLRYVAEPQKPALAAMSDLSAWRRAPGGTVLVAGDVSTLQLRAERGRLVYAFQTLWPLAPPTVLRIEAEIRGEDLGGARVAGGTGQVLALSLDRQQRRLVHWPSRVASLDGTSAWHTARLVLPVRDNAPILRLAAFVSGDSGLMEIRNLRIEPVVERLAFTLARYLLMATWLALGAWCAWRLLRPGRQRLARALLAGAATLAIVAGLAPPPTMNLVTSRVLASAEGGLQALSALFEPDTVTGAAPAGDDDSATAAAPAAGSGRADTGGKQSGAAGDDASQADETATTATVEPNRRWIPTAKNLDKRGHLAGFALLALLAAFAFRSHSAWRVLPALALLAASIETLQSFTVMREADALDLAAGLLGAFSGVLTAWLATRLVRVFRRR